MARPAAAHGYATVPHSTASSASMAATLRAPGSLGCELAKECCIIIIIFLLFIFFNDIMY